MSQNFKEFIVTEVELSGSNLIEASAGTGKTYSIAILMLRLILENKVPIKEILMVTFTNAAVAELEERIRRFVRMAYRYAQNEEIADKTIKEIVDGTGKEDAVVLLKSAVLNLDETSVMTIHGFCQQTLSEFAFETGQLFSAELIPDNSQVLEGEVQKFWRKHITGIRKDLLGLLSNHKLNMSDIQRLVKSHIGGKNYLVYDKSVHYSFEKEKQNEFFNTISVSKNQYDKLLDEITNYIENNTNELIESANKNHHSKSSLLPYVNNPAKFLSVFKDKRETAYANNNFPALKEQVDRLILSEEEYKIAVEECLNFIYAYAIQEISASVDSFMYDHNLFSYDDLIGNLHKALVLKPNPKLENELRRKYRAVFIDEFQDTDKLQFEIFHQAFQTGSETVLFYIGDPKQSIYGFRKADIFTYFKARNSVNPEKRYMMKTNFRSSSNLVAALNKFFLSREPADIFHYEGEADVIEYIEVNTPKNNDKGELTLIENCAPVSITTLANKTEIGKDVAKRVLDLLMNKAFKLGESQKRVMPSDIGILVKSHADGENIRNELDKFGIPCVTGMEIKILNTAEANEMLFLLEAFTDNRLSKINKALVGAFIRWNDKQISNINEEVVINIFNEIKAIWSNQKVYAALMRFAKVFELKKHLLDENPKGGERILTNFYHLAEILYKVESRQHLTPDELISWLKKRKGRDDSAEDERQQRIETDEQAVKIVTIHSSKGLEYPIVFAPTLDFVVDAVNGNTMEKIAEFRDDKDGEYYSGKLGELSTEQYALFNKQKIQENRRLLYVSLTRAVYKCFIYHSNGATANSTLSHFLNDSLYDNELIEEGDKDFETAYQRYIIDHQVSSQSRLSTEQIKFRESNWQQMSYSGLSAHLNTSVRESYTKPEENYDRFIFKDLRKGTRTGTFLHFIFENLNFSNSESWQYAIDKAILRFMPNKKNDEKFIESIRQFLNHVMNANLNTGNETFKLSSIYQSQILHELEFDFPVLPFEPKQLESLMSYGILISNYYIEEREKIEGMMTGFIDLFFEYKGKYYVLDWKSNYLGPSLNDYSIENVRKAMNENNYHLQYLIYSLAVKKYLKSRIGEGVDFKRQFGGVFYLFVRGMRADNDFGVFHYKPTDDKIIEIENILETTVN